MSYIVTSDYGSKRVDIARFAADLAAELGATARPYRDDYPNENQRIDLPGDVYLYLRADDHKRRVTVSLSASDVRHDERNWHDKDQRTIEATVNPDGRPMAAIARDVRKRVIEANAPAIAAQRAFAASRRDHAAGIEAIAARIGKVADVRINDDRLGASIYLNRNGAYLGARINSSNSITIDRFGSITEAQFLAIVDVLTKAG